MTKEQTNELNVTIGEIEDTLRGIQSARDQVNAVLQSNATLSRALNTLVGQTTQVIDSTRQQTESLNDSIQAGLERLDGHGREIDELVGKAVESIEEQTAQAESSLGSTAFALSEKAVESLSAAAGEALSEFTSATDAAQSSLSASAERLEASSAEFCDRQAQQTEDFKRLLDQNERQLAEAKASIDRIADVDLEQTNMRLDELRKLVEALAQEESVQRKTVIALLVICIIGIFAIIAKLFMS